jgi:hypothetical protein
VNLSRAVAAVLCMLAVSACQTTTYKSISPNIRLATTYEGDAKTKVLGTRYEMLGEEGWFEAEKTSAGSYKLTAKGAADQEMATEQKSDESDSGESDSGC